MNKNASVGNEGSHCREKEKPMWSGEGELDCGVYGFELAISV